MRSTDPIYAEKRLFRKPSSATMHRQKIRNSGWAAFDRKWRGIGGGGDEGVAEPFPSILGPSAPGSGNGSTANNIGTRTKSFSTVIRPSVAAAVGNSNNKGKGSIGDVATLDYHVNSAAEIASAVKMLKDVHSWADDNLIDDVLAGVDNDVGLASALLQAMVSPRSETGESSASAQFASESNNKEIFSMRNPTVSKDLPNGAHMLPLPMNVCSVPLEPEWEEIDDLYLNLRKDAIKMVRAATQHSRGASNAFLRGDHAAARQLSLRAQEERMAAEKLNSKAAEEIFRLRNCNNGFWKVDLHGLHASEAITALERHLHKIECQQMADSAASSDEVAKLDSVTARSRSPECFHCSDVESTEQKAAFARPRQAALHVITGIGKHSRGEASLPVAVRSFLIEKGYRYDEVRPGVFSVRPKFRRQ